MAHNVIYKDIIAARAQARQPKKLPKANILVPFIVAWMVCLSGCSSLNSAYPVFHTDEAAAIAQAAGVLTLTGQPQTQPQVVRYLEFTDKLSDKEDFTGKRFLGIIPTSKGNLGCVAILPKNPPYRGTIIGFHGYLAYSAYIVALLEMLAEKGWACFAVDLPGHGFSEGARGNIDSFESYGQAAKDVVSWLNSRAEFGLAQPTILLGHSLGGAAVIGSQIWKSPTLNIDAVILLAPLIRPAYSFSLSLAPLVAFGSGGVRSPSGDDGYLGVQYMPLGWLNAVRDWWILVENAKPIRIPGLCIQGQSDTVVDWRWNIKVITRILPDVKITYLPKTGHVLTVNDDIRAKTFALINTYLDTQFP